MFQSFYSNELEISAPSNFTNCFRSCKTIFFFESKMLLLKQLAINSLNNDDLLFFLKKFIEISENSYHDILNSKMVFDSHINIIKCGPGRFWQQPIELNEIELINFICRRMRIVDFLIEQIDTQRSLHTQFESIYSQRRCEILAIEQNFSDSITLLTDISSAQQYGPDRANRSMLDETKKGTPERTGWNIAANSWPTGWNMAAKFSFRWHDPIETESANLRRNTASRK